MLVFCNTGKRKLSFTFRESRVLAALPAIPSRDIPATGVRRPCSIPRFARPRSGTHVLLQGRQIAFERPCRHPRAPRPELSGEVRNCHLSASNRSSDAITEPAHAACCSSARHGHGSTLPTRVRLPLLPSSRHPGCAAPSSPSLDASAPRCGLQAPQLPL